MSAVSLAGKVKKALKVAKRADKNAKKALERAGTPGAQGGAGATRPSGPPGPAGPNGTDGADGADVTPGAPGAPGAPGPSAHRIDVSLANGANQDAPVGPFTLRFACSGDSAHRLFTMAAPGGSGGVQLTGMKSIDDAFSTMTPFSTGAGLPAGVFVGIGVNSPNPNNTSGHFYRMGGTMVLHNGLTVTTVVYDMFLENRSNQGTCHFRGTGVQSGLL